MSAPYLCAQGICLIKRGTPVLTNVSIELYSGEIHALLGNNGSGKTMLINLLGGLYERSAGTITLEGAEITGTQALQNPAVFLSTQELTIYDQMTVAENIFIGMERSVGGILLNRRKMHRMAQKALDKLHLDIAPDRIAGELSRPEKYLMQFARLLISKPKLILLDEPASISASEFRLLYDVLSEFRDQGAAILCVMHRIRDVLRFSDRVTTINDGRTVATFRTEDADEERILQTVVGDRAFQQYPRLPVKVGCEMLVMDHVTTQRLHDIAFSLHKGEILGVAGITGAGRTSLLRTFAGLEEITGGMVRIGRHYPQDHLMIGYLPENRDETALFSELDVSDNLIISNLRKVSSGFLLSPKKQHFTTEDLLMRLGIHPPNHRGRIGHLSNGNKQKLLVARALHANCNVYLFDEPTQGVDIAGRIEIYNIMNELVRKGCAIIMVSSDYTELVGMCNRVIVLQSGRLIQDGTNTKGISEILEKM